MWRCLELAKKGRGKVEPNPMVGALLLHQDKVIGEGFHEAYGLAHAEVNAINDAISHGRQDLLKDATLYVTLEPCSHYGKTAPCADLIIQKKIPRVVIGCMDPNPEVNGNGVKKLKEAGIEVTIIHDQALKDAAEKLILPFTRPLLDHRPYIILKWAETADGYMGSGTHERLRISNAFSDRLVHKWRSETTGILIGKNTALLDDPLLNNRLWPGPSPVRMVIDKELELPSSLKLFKAGTPLVIFNYHKNQQLDQVNYVQLKRDIPLLKQLPGQLYALKIYSLMVEGGPALLRSFINEALWDEIRVIKSGQLSRQGLSSPEIIKASLFKNENLLGDQVSYYYPQP